MTIIAFLVYFCATTAPLSVIPDDSSSQSWSPITPHSPSWKSPRRRKTQPSTSVKIFKAGSSSNELEEIVEAELAIDTEIGWIKKQGDFLRSYGPLIGKPCIELYLVGSNEPLKDEMKFHQIDNNDGSPVKLLMEVEVQSLQLQRQLTIEELEMGLEPMMEQCKNDPKCERFLLCMKKHQCALMGVNCLCACTLLAVWLTRQH